MKKKSFWGATVSLLTVFIVVMWQDGNGTLMKKLTLEELTQKAKVIVIGKVASILSGLE